nr:hypothetical protein [Tanacetum cinerariifolium]
MSRRAAQGRPLKQVAALAITPRAGSALAALPGQRKCACFEIADVEMMPGCGVGGRGQQLAGGQGFGHGGGHHIGGVEHGHAALVVGLDLGLDEREVRAGQQQRIDALQRGVVE